MIRIDGKQTGTDCISFLDYLSEHMEELGAECYYAFVMMSVFTSHYSKVTGL